MDGGVSNAWGGREFIFFRGIIMAQGEGLGATGAGWIKTSFIKNSAVSTAKIADDAVTVAKLDDDVLQTATVTISTVLVKTLNATPQTLVAAPGAGKALIFLGAQLMLDYNSVAYDGVAAGEDLAIKYTNASGAQVGQIEATGFLDQAADEHRWAYPVGASAAALAQVEFVANSPLVLHMLTGEIATGNSPLRVKTYYRVIDVDLAA